jgi:transposase
MSEAKKKRMSYGPEFKAKVGLEAVRGVKTINEIAQEYSVHPVLVGQWKKEILEQAGTLFEGKRGPKRKTLTRARIGCTARSGG